MPQLDFFKSIDEILLAFSALGLIYCIIILYIIPSQIERLGIQLIISLQNEIKQYTIESYFITFNHQHSEFYLHLLN